MRIGVYASAVASDRGHERNVSAHIQLPVETIRRLRDAGHDARLVTNRFGPEHVLPAALAEGVPVHLVDDGRVRPKMRRGGGKGGGIRPLGLLRQLAQTRAIARREGFDVLHCFGLARTAMLGGVQRMIDGRTPVVATLVAGNIRPGPMVRPTLARLDAILASTEYAANQVLGLGLDAEVVRHGVVRDLVREYAEVHPGRAPGPRTRVLFWRDPNEMNGADLCIEAFDRLAPEFPGFTFEFAVRPTRHEVPGLPEIEARHPNVRVHRFPYPEGMSLPLLIAESALVVLPFRRLTVDPQLAIAESLAAGVPTVASGIRSNAELVEEGVTGRIAALDAASIAESVRSLLADPAALSAMQARTADRFAARWRWDGYVPALEAIYERVRHRR